MKLNILRLGLPDYVEDQRHITMSLRRWLTKKDLDQLGAAPRALVDVANRAVADPVMDVDPANLAELDLANKLCSQYEEALVFLGSMIPD